MAKKQTVASKVRKLLNEGVPAKDIAKKFNLKPQTVYNIRYQANKKQGVGALPNTVAIVDGGVASVPRRRGRPPKKQSAIVVPPKTEKQYTPTEPEITSDVKAWGIALAVAFVVAIVLAIAL